MKKSVVALVFVLAAVRAQADLLQRCAEQKARLDAMCTQFSLTASAEASNKNFHGVATGRKDLDAYDCRRLCEYFVRNVNYMCIAKGYGAKMGEVGGTISPRVNLSGVASNSQSAYKALVSAGYGRTTFPASASDHFAQRIQHCRYSTDPHAGKVVREIRIFAELADLQKRLDQGNHAAVSALRESDIIRELNLASVLRQACTENVKAEKVAAFGAAGAAVPHTKLAPEAAKIIQEMTISTMLKGLTEGVEVLHTVFGPPMADRTTATEALELALRRATVFSGAEKQLGVGAGTIRTCTELFCTWTWRVARLSHAVRDERKRQGCSDIPVVGENLEFDKDNPVLPITENLGFLLQDSSTTGHLNQNELNLTYDQRADAVRMRENFKGKVRSSVTIPWGLSSSTDVNSTWVGVTEEGKLVQYTNQGKEINSLTSVPFEQVPGVRIQQVVADVGSDGQQYLFALGTNGLVYISRSRQVNGQSRFTRFDETRQGTEHYFGWREGNPIEEIRVGRLSENDPNLQLFARVRSGHIVRLDTTSRGTYEAGTARRY